jgi:DNA-binding transcriptional MerR regulator
MYVTELARATGIAPDTVRYYTKTGLLKPARDPEKRSNVSE